MTFRELITQARLRAGVNVVPSDGAESADDLSLSLECERAITSKFLTDTVRFSIDVSEDEERVPLKRDVSHIESLFYNNTDITLCRVKASEIQLGE